MFNLEKKYSFNNKNELNNSFLFSGFRSKIAGAIFSLLGIVNTSHALDNQDNFHLSSENSLRTEYIVKKGDSLYKISNNHSIDLEYIFKLNPGLRSRKHLIYPGEKIIISVNNTLSEKENNNINENNLSHNLNFINYTVKRNDNLWSISRNFNVSIADIIKENPSLSTRKNLIHPGEILKIPYLVGNISNFDNSKTILESFNTTAPANESSYLDDIDSNNFLSFSNEISKIISENYKNNINPSYLIPNRCGPNIREALKAFGFNDIPSSGMNGYVYSRVLDRLSIQGKVLKVQISHPNEAKPGAILVYDRGFGRPGSPRYNYGHVEKKLENGYFRGHVNETYGGSVTGTNSQTGFTGYAYYIIGNNNFQINNSNGYFLNLDSIKKSSSNIENINNVREDTSDKNEKTYIELNEIDTIISKIRNTGLYYTYLLKYFETNNLKYLSFIKNKYNVKISKIASLKSSYLTDKLSFTNNINTNLSKLKLAYKKYYKRKLSLEHFLSIEIARGIYVLPDDFEEKKSLINIKYKKTA